MVSALVSGIQARIGAWATREELSGMTDSGTRDRAEGTIDEMKGHGKQALGDLTGDDRTKAEGMMDEAKGKAQQAWGDLKDEADKLKDDVERRT